MTDEPSSEHAGRVAVVTGGCGGFGQGIARRLLDEGATVHVMDVVPWPGPADDRLRAHEVDVRSEQSVTTAFEGVVRQDGAVHYLVCCAGVYRAQPFLELSLDEWQQTLAVNLRGTFLSCRAALPSMRESRFGRIVLFSSMIARTGGIGSGHYAASKAGVLGLARTLALEVAQEGIRVNTISPGIADTPMPRRNLSEAEVQSRAEHIPLGCIARVDDVVEACLFLLGEESSYLTGQDLRLNGGASLW